MNKNETLKKQFISSRDIFKLKSETARASRAEARSKCVNNAERTPTIVIWNNMTQGSNWRLEGLSQAAKTHRNGCLERSQMKWREIRIKAA